MKLRKKTVKILIATVVLVLVGGIAVVLDLKIIKNERIIQEYKLDFKERHSSILTKENYKAIVRDSSNRYTSQSEEFYLENYGEKDVPINDGGQEMFFGNGDVVTSEFSGINYAEYEVEKSFLGFRNSVKFVKEMNVYDEYILRIDNGTDHIQEFVLSDIEVDGLVFHRWEDIYVNGNDYLISIALVDPKIPVEERVRIAPKFDNENKIVLCDLDFNCDYDLNEIENSPVWHGRLDSSIEWDIFMIFRDIFLLNHPRDGWISVSVEKDYIRFSGEKRDYFELPYFSFLKEDLESFSDDRRVELHLKGLESPISELPKIFGLEDISVQGLIYNDFSRLDLKCPITESLGKEFETFQEFAEFFEEQSRCEENK